MKETVIPNNDPFRGSNNPLMSENALGEMRHLRKQRELLEAGFDEDAWEKRFKSIKRMKRTSFSLTQSNYNDLFAGKVRYLKTGYETEDNGSIKIAFKSFVWKLFHRHGECPYKQPQRFQHFIFTTSMSGYSFPVWNNDEMRALIQDNNILPGDMISLYYVGPKNGGCGYWCAGGREYVVLKNGWKMIGRIMGQ